MELATSSPRSRARTRCAEQHQAPAPSHTPPTDTAVHLQRLGPCHERRHQLIQEIAYALAEKRGFAPGGEMQDWLQAEAEVDQWVECEHFSGD
jgi:hypothetical protein